MSHYHHWAQTLGIFWRVLQSLTDQSFRVGLVIRPGRANGAFGSISLYSHPMADLFVSYASQDRAYVSELVKEFESQGWTVWWDRQIEAGTSFDKTIENAIDTARCIVVVWSTFSINSDWVRAEAAEGLQRNILIPILLDDVRPPLLFRQKQAISLIEWKQADSDQKLPLSSLIPTIRKKLDLEQNSLLPVSTQRAWVLDNVFDMTEEKHIAPALYEAAKLALEFFEGLFVYPGDMSEQPNELVDSEGLDGAIRISIGRCEDQFELILQVDPAKDENITLSARVNTDADLILSLGNLLVEAAVPLQGTYPFRQVELVEYLQDRNIHSLYYLHRGQVEEKSNRWQEAKKMFKQSIALDPKFSHARSALSLACRALGQFEESKQNMAIAVELLGKDSDRETHHFRGMYHFLVTEDMEKAANEFKEVIHLSPMDRSALNNLAVCRFQELDFVSANELSARDLQLYPSQGGRLGNAALFALYAGKFDRALDLEAVSRKSAGSLLIASVIPPLVEAERGNLSNAIELASSVKDTNTYSVTLLADLLMATEEWQAADQCIEEGIKLDSDSNNYEQLARKKIMKAEQLFCSSGNSTSVRGQLEEAMKLSNSTETLVSVCILCARFGIEPIANITKDLRRKVDRKSRAYAKMAIGIESYFKGDLGECVEQIKSAIDVMDLWAIRYCLGFIYLTSGLTLDARDQFSNCNQRAGEGLFAVLDDIATYRCLHAVRENL